MSSSNVFQKDSNAVLDYGFDWSQWLEGDETISGFNLSATSGIIMSGCSLLASGSVIVWLTSGCAGQRYKVACLIETSGSRIDERTINIDVRER